LEPSVYKGWSEIHVSPEFLQVLKQEHSLPLDVVFKEEGIRELEDINPNHYFIFHGGEEEPLLARCIFQQKENGLEKIISHLPTNIERPVKGRNLRQILLIDALFSKDIPIVYAMGPAGTGKTYLAIAAGWRQGRAGNAYGDIIIARPLALEGEDIGALPGTQEAKLKPWLDPIYDNLSATGPKRGARRDDPLEVQDLAKIQGRSIRNKYLLIDESQNLRPSEAKMCVTRLAEGSKMVFTGDPEQVGTRLRQRAHLDETNNGIVYLSENTKESIYTATIYFTYDDVERSAAVKDILKRLP